MKISLGYERIPYNVRIQYINIQGQSILISPLDMFPLNEVLP